MEHAGMTLATGVNLDRMLVANRTMNVVQLLSKLCKNILTPGIRCAILTDGRKQ